MSWWSNKIAIDLEQITGYSNAGYALISNGTGNQPTWQATSGSVAQADIIAAGGTVVLSRSATPQTVTESGQPVQTDLLGYTIPGGTLTANRVIRVRLAGLYLNNSGAARIPTLRVTLGGTTLYADGWISSNASASQTVWDLEFTLAAESLTLVHLTGDMRQTGVTAPDTGLGALDASMRMDASISAAAGGVTVSSLASNRALTVDFQHPINTATQTLVRTHYSVELLP
jgi:hypothetical protein